MNPLFIKSLLCALPRVLVLIIPININRVEKPLPEPEKTTDPK